MEGAIAVGEQLLAQAVPSARQITWKRTDKLTGAESFDQNDLYSGASGIGLFFLELYKHTGKAKYLRIAQKAVQTAFFREESRQVYAAFITGRLGISYALLKLYEVTQNRRYLSQALKLAKTCRYAFNSAHEYINGNAGAVVCLLHLHAASREPWLLEMVNDYAERIVQGTQRAVTGIFWDRNSHQVRPLCGFSHGTSGVGFMFLELGRYLGNRAYYAFADAAFAYENAHFDEAAGNWPDFRLDMWNAEKMAAMEWAYVCGNLAGFTKAGNMAAWCHGAPGIGLARLRAYHLTRQRLCLDDLNCAVAATKRAVLHGVSLCHGSAGNLDLFIEDYVVLGRKRAWREALTAGKSLLRQWHGLHARMQADPAFAARQDFGLLTGIAGAGYTLLRLHNPQLTPSILAPRMQATAHPNIPKQLNFLNLTPPDVAACLAVDSAGEPSAVRQLRRDMVAHYPSSGLLFVKNIVLKKQAPRLLGLSDDELLTQTLRLDEDCRLQLTSPAEGVLLRYTPEKIEQKRISQFCYAVLAAFQTPQTVQSAIANIAKMYHCTPRQYEQVRAKALEQTRQALYAIILVSDDTSNGAK